MPTPFLELGLNPSQVLVLLLRSYVRWDRTAREAWFPDRPDHLRVASDILSRLGWLYCCSLGLDLDMSHTERRRFIGFELPDILPSGSSRVDVIKDRTLSERDAIARNIIDLSVDDLQFTIGIVREEDLEPGPLLIAFKLSRATWAAPTSLRSIVPDVPYAAVELIPQLEAEALRQRYDKALRHLAKLWLRLDTVEQVIDMIAEFGMYSDKSANRFATSAEACRWFWKTLPAERRDDSPKLLASELIRLCTIESHLGPGKPDVLHPTITKWFRRRQQRSEP